MKKLTKVLLAAILSLSLFGCSSGGGSGNADSGKTVITFWGHQNEPWNNAYKAVAAEFEAANPEYKINFEFFPYDTFESKVQTSLISKTGGADMYELWGGWGVDFAPTGALAKIPDELAANIENEVYEPTIGALMYDGNLYGLPLEFNIEVGGMLVNNILLEAQSATIPTTWDELVATAASASKVENDIFQVKGFDFVNWDSVPYIFTSMILSKGGNYLTEDGKITFSNPIAEEAFAELVSMVQDSKVTDLEGLVGGGELEGYQQLYAGKALFVPRGPWTISEGVESFGLVLGEDFDYVALPFYGDEKAFAAETGWSMAVNENSKVKEGAFKFLEFLFQDEQLLKLNIACTQIPAKKSVATNPELITQMPYAEVLVGILDNAQFIGHFNTDIFKEGINNKFVEYNQGQYTDVKTALTDLETELNEKLFK
ncbi:extracellular solute-binding protein [Anaerorhabdus sp.]|uniref:extracellular solute-binding protein n=1 Tax=Anaerorhabdus sp. TaxID=1872524 RepID=UPI002B1F1E30|nr:extracellular solute-binding protein [Anaerorhabdus sp.]MEA4876252.1 extracellular solute-binding protein [Anaerorhabdus sp.]